MQRPASRIGTHTSEGTNDQLNVCVFQFLLRKGELSPPGANTLRLLDPLSYDWF